MHNLTESLIGSVTGMTEFLNRLEHGRSVSEKDVLELDGLMNAFGLSLNAFCDAVIEGSLKSDDFESVHPSVVSLHAALDKAVDGITRGRIKGSYQGGERGRHRFLMLLREFSSQLKDLAKAYAP